MLAAKESNIPKAFRTAYAACVRRVTKPRESAFFPMNLRERLPALPIPLRPKDREIALQLQELIDLCYERGRYFKIDYDEDLDPPLDADDTAWARERIEAWKRQ